MGFNQPMKTLTATRLLVQLSALAIAISIGSLLPTAIAQTSPPVAGVATTPLPNFPPPELATTCEPARALASEVDGKLDDAKVAAYEQRAVTLCINELGALHATTMSLMRNLAITYTGLRKYDKALVLWDQLVISRRTTRGSHHPDTLRATSSLALAHSNLNQFEKALPLYEQVLKERRATLGQDHPDTLVVMNDVAITFGNLGQFDKSVSLVQQLLRLRTSSQGADHADTLEVMYSLANLYSKLGQYENALLLEQDLFKLLHSKLGVDHIDTMRTSSRLAISYLLLGESKKALELQEQVLQRTLLKVEENHPSVLAMMINLALIYNEIGLYEKALPLVMQTLKFRRIADGEDHPNTVVTLSNLANTYYNMGQFDKALPLQELALKLRRASLGDDHADTLLAMNELANTLGRLGQYDKALALREQAIQLLRINFGADNSITLLVQGNLAGDFTDLGQFSRALILNKQTLQQRRAVLGEDHPQTLVSILTLAQSYTELGQFEQSRELNEQAFKKFSEKFGEVHPQTLSAMNALATAYSDLGQFGNALLLNERALKLRRESQGNENIATLGSMHNLARNFRATRQYAKALDLVIEIKNGVEKIRELDLSTDIKQSVFARYSDDYQRYSAWYATQGKFTEGFEIADLSKARSLADSIRGQAAIGTLGLLDRSRLSDLQSKLLIARKKSETLNEKNKPSTESILAAQKDLDLARGEFLQLQIDLKVKNPKYAQLVSLKPATVSQAQALLVNTEVFISYLVQTDGVMHAYVLDKNANPKWVDLGSMANLALTISAYRELVVISSGANPVNNGVDAGDLRAASRRLNIGVKLVELKEGGYQWLAPGQPTPQDSKPVADTPAAALLVLNKYFHDKLIKPLLPLAGNFKSWIISPDKDLALLPFDTLIEEFNTAGDVSKIVAQNRNVTIVQSFAVYALLKQREKEYAKLARPKELMAMGNPVYADGWSSPKTASQDDIPRDEGTRSFQPNERPGITSSAPLKRAAEQYSLTRGTWKNLPGTAREVIAVAKSFGASDKGSATVDVFTGTDASEPKMQSMQAQGKLKDYKYLLFSAHGYLAQNPSLSALVLTQRGNPEGIDGYITAAKWPLYDIRSDLTVLSACDTGVGKTQAGEGVMGLPYALFIAGNKNTLLSLWPVDDDATAEFMSRFFAKLKAGQVQPEALSQTKREFMQHAKWNAPKYWAAFVLYGV